MKHSAHLRAFSYVFLSCRKSVEHGLTSQQLEETVKIGGSFFEQLAENSSEASSRTEMRVSPPKSRKDEKATLPQV